MAITNGYITLAEFKLWADPPGTVFDANANDDSIIEKLIEAASRRIDLMSGRRFYASTETHYFDIPSGRELRLRDDLLSVTTFLNGDGTTISSSDYALVDYNITPYYAIRLTEYSSVNWQLSATSGTEKALSIAGSWGYSTTAPLDIQEACFEIAKNAYNRRTGQGDQVARITAAGVVLSPADIPGWIRDLMNNYKRIT